MTVERSEPPNFSPEGRRVMKNTRRGLGGAAANAEAASGAQAKERDLPAFDPFDRAIRLRREWLGNPLFQDIFDKSVIKIIDDSTLDAYSSHDLKARLELPAAGINPDSDRTSNGDLLRFLAAEMATYPGRLVDANRTGDKEGDIVGYRIWLMQRAVQLFTSERMSLNDIVEKKFMGNPEAELLLKGGIAEVLHARSVHDQANRWRS